jgi:hypothetical protein
VPIAAALVLCLCGGMAPSVDFARAAVGIQSDEATYSMVGHSLAQYGDHADRREDLARVWRACPSGPSGVCLKKGTDANVQTSGAARSFVSGASGDNRFLGVRVKPELRP